jgi:hypothetical protein
MAKTFLVFLIFLLLLSIAMCGHSEEIYWLTVFCENTQRSTTDVDVYVDGVFVGNTGHLTPPGEPPIGNTLYVTTSKGFHDVELRKDGRQESQNIEFGKYAYYVTAYFC